MRDENDSEVSIFLCSLFLTIRERALTRFLSLLKGIWIKMHIKKIPQALYNTLIMKIKLSVYVCVINYL